MILGIVVAAVIALILAHRSYRYRQIERAEGYRKAAALRGWKVDADPMQLRYSGTTGDVPWTFVSAPRGDRQGEIRHLSRWETPYVRAERLVVVWPRETRARLQLEIPEAIRNFVLRPLANALGVTPSELAAADRDEVLEAALDDTQIIAALVTRDGMRIVVPTLVANAEEVDKIVRLGAKLARTRAAHRVL